MTKPKLTPAQQRRIMRALYPHDVVLSQRFPGPWIDAWRKAADRADMSLLEWTSTMLNKAAGVKL